MSHAFRMFLFELLHLCFAIYLTKTTCKNITIRVAIRRVCCTVYCSCTHFLRHDKVAHDLMNRRCDSGLSWATGLSDGNLPGGVRLIGAVSSEHLLQGTSEDLVACCVYERIQTRVDETDHREHTERIDVHRCDLQWKTV